MLCIAIAAFAVLLLRVPIKTEISAFVESKKQCAVCTIYVAELKLIRIVIYLSRKSAGLYALVILTKERAFEYPLFPPTGRGIKGAGHLFSIIRKKWFGRAARLAVRIENVTGELSVGGDAALAAVFSGALEAIFGIIEISINRIDIHTRLFAGGGTKLRLECITSTRAGRIALSAMMIMAGIKKERRKQ